MAILSAIGLSRVLAILGAIGLSRVLAILSAIGLSRVLTILGAIGLSRVLAILSAIGLSRVLTILSAIGLRGEAKMKIELIPMKVYQYFNTSLHPILGLVVQIIVSFTKLLVSNSLSVLVFKKSKASYFC